MKRYNYKHVPVSEDTHRKLEKLRMITGSSSFDEAIVVLFRAYNSVKKGVANGKS